MTIYEGQVKCDLGLNKKYRKGSSGT